MHWPIGFLDKPVTSCVHFIRTSESDGALEAKIEAAKKVGIKFAYWNYLDGGKQSRSVASPLASALGLDHPPYGPNLPWTEFLDDLITFAYRYDGLVIVVDRADFLLGERSDELFNCAEA